MGDIEEQRRLALSRKKKKKRKINKDAKNVAKITSFSVPWKNQEKPNVI